MSLMANDHEYLRFSNFKLIDDQGDRETSLQIVVDQNQRTIVKMGSEFEVDDWFREQGSSGVTDYDLSGHYLVPGLIDAHTHPAVYAVFRAIRALNISQASYFDAIFVRIKDKLEHRKYLLCNGWDSVRVPDISKDKLDRIDSTKPVALIDGSLHGGVGNSLACELIAQEAEYIKRFHPMKGELRSDGTFTEDYAYLAIEVFEKMLPSSKIASAMVEWLEIRLELGIVGIHELAAFNAHDLKVMAEAKNKWGKKHPDLEFPIQKIFIKHDILMKLSVLDRKARKLFDEYNDAGKIGVKLFADGSFESYTARLSTPYKGDANRGNFFLTASEVKHVFKLAEQQGIREIAVHAIGDAAVKRVIGYGKIWLKDQGNKFRIEHFELSKNRKILNEVQSLGIIASTQPTFLTDVVACEGQLGKRRLKKICPHQSIISRDIPLIFGTDGMPESVIFGIWAAVHHPFKEERLSLAQTIYAYSAAVGKYQDTLQGQLVEGAPADLVVLSPEAVKELQSRRTAVEIREFLQSEVRIGNLISQLNAGIQMVIKSGRIFKDTLLPVREYIQLDFSK